MRYAVKKSILQFSIVSATTAIALTTTTNAWSANLNFVSSRDALAANDFVDWSSSTLNINRADPAIFSINSAGGIGVTGSQAGAFGQIRVQNPTSYIVGTNSPSGGNAFQNTGSNSQGTPYWNGNFAANDVVYWNQGSANGTSGLTLSFATPVSAVGAQLDSAFYHNSQTPVGVSPFRGTITAFYGNGLSRTYSSTDDNSTINPTIITSALANNSAPFFGFTSDAADITSIVFNTTDPYNNDGFNFALNRVSICTTICTTPQSVPEPFSIVGTLVGGAAALKLRRRLKVTNKL